MAKSKGRHEKERAAKVKAGADAKAAIKTQMAHKRGRGVAM